MTGDEWQSLREYAIAAGLDFDAIMADARSAAARMAPDAVMVTDESELDAMVAHELGHEPDRVGLARNLSTPESRAFWASAERSAAEVEAWPDWKKGWK